MYSRAIPHLLLPLCEYSSTISQLCTALHYTRLHYTALRYTTLHYTALHYTRLRYTTLHSITLDYATLHCTALHYTTLHCTALHYTALLHTQLYSPSSPTSYLISGTPTYHLLPRTVTAFHGILSISTPHLTLQLQLQLQLSIDCIPLGRGDPEPGFCTKRPPIKYPTTPLWRDDWQLRWGLTRQWHLYCN